MNTIASEINKDELTRVSQAHKARQYFILLKPRLSFLVAFSAGFGYLLGVKANWAWSNFIGLMLGGFLITGASVIINQILEKDLDRLMRRTARRPLPAQTLTVSEASNYAFWIGLLGFVLLMAFTNLLTALLALFSVFLYGFIYTPLKRMGPIAVIVGAIPGALPPVLGWVAATGKLGFEAFILFTLQFVWQFPHFWAIAWVADEDYQRAGFHLLPSQGGTNFNSALQIVLSALFLIPVGWMPYQLGLTGWASAWVATLAAVLFCLPAFFLLRTKSRKTALQIMFASFLYLPIIQIAFLWDKL
ncbi:MAG: heme o synthase [Microscillaceae bacterium]